jgi:DNA-binding transcriptional LysR family regulator
MFDFRLKVFNTVAKRLSFTKAANELNITQPAVSKHIKEIEQQLNTKLFDRNGTKISLTVTGSTLLEYTEKIFTIYRELEFEVSQLNQKQEGIFRIGASTTIAQYVLPSLLAAFHQQFKDIKVELSIHNTEVIEQSLIAQKIDLGMIEGRSKNKSFQYSPFIKDEIVLVASAQHPFAYKNALSLTDLKNIPLLLREPGSGTLEIIAFELKNLGIKLNELKLEMQLANTESIKGYLLHSNCMAFVSIHAVLQELKNKTLVVVDVKNLNILRDFYFIQSQGEQAAIANLFLKFARSYNFK